MKGKHNIQVYILIAIVWCCSCSFLQAQSARKKGDHAWAIGKYKTAVNNYSNVANILEDKELLAKRGLGYFKLNKLKRAINDFTLSKKLGNDDPELFFLMAQTKQHLNSYEEAAFFFKQYVNAVGDRSNKAQLALREIKNCAYSAFHQKDEATAFIESFGDQVNTYYDEVYPLQSPLYGNTFYFSSNRNLKNNNVYAFSINEKGDWEETPEYVEGINSEFNEYVMDVSPDTKSMLFTKTKGAEISTQIYVSTFDENDEQHIVEIPEYLLDGAVDLQIVDRNTIAFASKELGGFGGYDIFTINYKNGIWSDPFNEGEIINTEYDERSPYFASSSEYLYFSSNRPYCFGGFDVYYYNKLGIEEAPTNMGAPLNSSGNELHFRLNIDGQMAVISSDRKSGAGAYDIYQVYLQEFRPMPSKDMAQLEYLIDYFNYINPKEVVKEAPKTHLDKLKEKIAKKEADKANAEPSDVVLEEDKLVDAEPVVKEHKNETNHQGVEVTKEDSKLDKEEASEPDVADIVLPRVKLPEVNQPVLEVIEPVVTKPESKQPSKEIVTTEVKVETESVVDEAGQVKEKVVVATTKEKKTRPTKPKVISPALPEIESGESPLTTIRKERKSAITLPIRLISGEHIQNTILYQDRHDLMNKINKEKLNKLINYLKSNLNHRVHFIAHTDHLELGLPEYMQYNTLKRANFIARYLTENGVGRDRISIESVCSNYPFVKPELAGKLNQDYLAYNKRVDWEILNSDDLVLKSHTLKATDIPGYAIDRKYELYTQLREEVYFSIEIASAPRIYKNAVLRLYSDLYIRKSDPNADNKYYIGLYNKYDEALELQKSLQESSADYAKIVPFYNGQLISKSQLNYLSKDYPDLDKYISASR